MTGYLSPPFALLSFSTSTVDNDNRGHVGKIRHPISEPEMSGSNAFGALAMDNSSPGAGPSRRQVEVLEVDADVSICRNTRRKMTSPGTSDYRCGHPHIDWLFQWLRLVKTNHDVNVRVSDKVDLHGLPHECNLMAVSNVWGLLVVGSSTGLFKRFGLSVAYSSCSQM